MATVLSVSSILLIVMITFRHFECVRGGRKVFELPRRRLDRITFKTLRKIGSLLKSVLEFVHKDIFLYVIHLIMYIALLLVRSVEQWLDKITSFIRSFRRRNKKKSTSEKLRGIERENKSSIDSEQNL